MAIEIKELVIKASVNKTSDSATDTGAVGKSFDQQKIIRICVEQVMEILKREKER